MSKYILQKDFFVSSADVDFEEKLRLSSLTNYLIQIASQHAESLSWGAADLIKHNLVWVLSGFQIEIDQYPNWRDTITIESWPKGVNRLFYLRDYRILNSEGKEIGRASTNWLLIDVDRRRPKLLDADNDVFEQNLDKHAIKALVPMLKFEGEVDKTDKFTPRFSDIDLNNHLTTTRYVDWMFDTYTPGEVSSRRAKTLIVNFRKEVKFNELVLMQRSINTDQGTSFQLISEDGKQAYFQGKLSF